MIPRIHWSIPVHIGQRLDLDDTLQRYLLRTLRLQPGAVLRLFTGLDLGEWEAVLVDRVPPRIEIRAFLALHSESPLSITLVQGVAKAEAMEWAVQKAVELGVARIIPLLCRRSASNAGGELTANRHRRLCRIAVEAAEQSGRFRVPEIHAPLSWQQLAPSLPPGPRWLFWEEQRTQHTLTAQPNPGQSLTLLVGPEGGLDPQEVAHAREQLGFVPLGLGPRILRTETAAITAISACQLLWGDMG